MHHGVLEKMGRGGGGGNQHKQKERLGGKGKGNSWEKKENVHYKTSEFLDSCF